MGGIDTGREGGLKQAEGWARDLGKAGAASRNEGLGHLFLN